MNEAAVVALVAFGLTAVVVRRRSAAIAAVSLQSLVLGLTAFDHVGGSSLGLIVAGSGLILKGALLPLILARTIRGARELRPITESVPALVRLAAALLISLAAVWLVGDLGLRPRYAASGAVVLVGIGVAIALLRQATLFQALGFVVAENGAYLAALSLTTGMPPLIEAALVFDLLLVVACAALFTISIRDRFGTADSAALRELTDL